MWISSPEGTTLIDDISELKLPINDMASLNAAEAENIMQAMSRYLYGKVPHPTKWFHVKFFQALHRSMFGKVWGWAGRLDHSQKNIGLNSHQVTANLEQLCRDVQFWLSNPLEIPILEQAARVHHRLTLIHPFKNGNGRFARLVGDRYLVAMGGKHPNWPHEILRSSSDIRLCYLRALRDADKGDYTMLIRLMTELGGSQSKTLLKIE